VASEGTTAVEWRADPVAVLDRVVAGIGGEPRDGQRQLTEAVADAISRGHHLLAEAPTGSGKSLAYLVPAVASGLRVVVATSTKALQSQLIEKDLPALQGHAGLPVRYALLKGRSNYLCLAKLRAAGEPDALFETPVTKGFENRILKLRRFAEESDTGDRADLDFPVGAGDWAAVSTSAIECPGKRDCADGDECFAERARDRARDVSVLVVNHALYCADLAAGGFVLPPHDVLVIDEAHAFNDSATDAFMDEIVPDRMTALVTMLKRAGAAQNHLDGLTRSMKALRDAIAESEGIVDVAQEQRLSGALVGAAERLASANGSFDKSATEYAKRTAQIATGRLNALRRLADPGEHDVVWVPFDRNSIRVAPVAAGEQLGARLLEHRPVVAVSATLGGEPPFTSVAMSVGLVPSAPLGAWGIEDDDGRPSAHAGRGYATLQAPSSFDWRTQAILYVGRDLPDPGSARDRWVQEAGERLCRLVDAAGGRALVLCTSRKNVDAFAELLRTRTDHEVLAQGDADPARLRDQFLENETSVLVGTRTYWQGIDAAGAACVLVVIDRIPFPVPTEPLHAARRHRAEARGIDAFAAVDLPAAALVLAQGAGRLIRRHTDQGVIAVLDSRLATKSYRAALLAAMPPFRRSIDLDEACAFLEEAAASQPVPVAPPSTVQSYEPHALRSDLSATANKTIRNTAGCPVCDATVTERCRDANGTSAYVHHARVAASEHGSG
jgi:ATP-dependent DNA helicase DinG